jgi:hypothetical protein
MNINDIKEEGRAGLSYAYDAQGNYISAADAVNGQEYKCPICGCAMHPTTTKKGRRIFARKPHTIHTNPECITIENSGVEHSFEGLDPLKFISSLCHASSKKKEATQDKSDSNNTSSESTSITVADTEPKLLKFTSLPQIAKSGVDHLKADDMQGDHKVSEFIMTYKFAKDFFTDPGFDLGARIVYAAFDGHIDKKNTLVFVMFNPHFNFSVRFHLVFPKKKDYKEYRDKFGHYEENEKGKTIFKRLYRRQTVLIASDDWVHLPTDSCNENCRHNDRCESCCGIYQAVFTNSKQLYLLPSDF